MSAACRFSFAWYFSSFAGSVWIGKMDGEVAQIHEERTVSVRLHEAGRFSRESDRKVLPVRSVVEHGVLIGREVARRIAQVRAADVAVEALQLGSERSSSEVPLADHRRRVAVLPEHFGDGQLFELQVLGPRRWEEPGVGITSSGDEVGEGAGVPESVRSGCWRAWASRWRRPRTHR